MKARFRSFLVEQHPFVLHATEGIIEKLFGDVNPASDLKVFGRKLSAEILSRIKPASIDGIEVTPFVSASQRLDYEASLFVESVDGFFAREQARLSITAEEKRWMLRGMILTRTVDLTLKKIFSSSDFKYNDIGFQGKGFRSLGQEAIYAAALRLRRGPDFSKSDTWQGDVVAPVIRDLGVALAFTGDDIESALNAQIGKAGLPTDGKDLHIGDYAKGVWPPAAPLAIATCSAVGVANAFKLRGESRVSVSFIGEGGSSLGEWHEAINFAACRQLPVVFCIENNQNALSTVVAQQSAVRVFAEKGKGYGIMSATIDGTDPEAIASAFAWSANRARAGMGPTLIELVSMRMCGHAHHDDMLYLGLEPQNSLDYPLATSTGYVNREKYEQWTLKDPLKVYARQLLDSDICTSADVEGWKAASKQRCEDALTDLKGRPWPKPEALLQHTFEWPKSKLATDKSEPAPAYSKEGATYMEAIAQAVHEQMYSDPRVFMLGEDVEPPYGNAFMMFRATPKELWPRFMNTPIAENAIVGALVGMAAEGLRPIGEMQFNDFSACAFNQIVNNAAKLHFRTKIRAPFVLRMPWGGLRRAGPYHSQDTIPWFSRAFGLNIVAPSTPHDARALFHAAMSSSDPVLFYEHIALYRDPTIKQVLPSEIPKLELGKAAIRRSGQDLTLVSYGAYVHRVMAVAKELAEEKNIQCDVIDLRSLVPVDFETLRASITKTNRVILVGEDSRTGSYLESLSSKIGEGLFSHLDAPVRVIGSLDTPIPYAPSLEDAFLASNALIYDAAVDLVSF